MILSFTKQNVLERDFVEKIAQGIKKHSFRVDNQKRWKIGMSIQLYAMSPRNKGKLFAKGRVVEIDEVELCYKPNEFIIHERNILEGHKVIYPKGIYSYKEEKDEIGINDGFNSYEEMSRYFLRSDMYKYGNFIDLRLIIWKLENIIARTKEELGIN